MRFNLCHTNNEQGNLKIRISRNLLPNPKENNHQALKDLEDTEIETL